MMAAGLCSRNSVPFYSEQFALAELETAAQRARHQSARFFQHPTGMEFSLRDGTLTFDSPYSCPHSENHTARAQWYPAASPTDRAVIVSPHWGAQPGAYRSLCSLLNRVGISCLEMVSPYHGDRAPAGVDGPEYAMSADLFRTIATTRQAVLEIRCAADWLETRGIRRFGLLGTSLGACYATLAAAHDARFGVNVFNHCAGWLSDVVWSGSSTREIRNRLESFLTADGLRSIWRAISPSTYFHALKRRPTKSLLLYGRYDTTFPIEHSLRTVQAFRELCLDYKAVEMHCGHQSLAWFPFNLIDAFQICSFLRENL